MSRERMRLCDQRAVYKQMFGHFLGLMTAEPEPIPVYSQAGIIETVRTRQLLIDEGYSVPHVDVLTRAALQDAVDVYSLRQMTPEDFHGRAI